MDEVETIITTADVLPLAAFRGATVEKRSSVLGDERRRTVARHATALLLMAAFDGPELHSDSQNRKACRRLTEATVGSLRAKLRRSEETFGTFSRYGALAMPDALQAAGSCAAAKAALRFMVQKCEVCRACKWGCSFVKGAC